MASEIRVDTVYNESGDSDSGLDMSTNDVVAVKIAGSEKVRVHSDGKLGVGTNSPDLSLDVSHGTTAEYVATFQNTADNLELKIGTTTGGVLNMQGANASNNNAYAFSLNADGGDVGVGVTPVKLLHVHEASTDDAEIHMTNTSSGATASDGLTIFANEGSAGLLYRENNAFRFFTNGSERARFTDAGHFLIDTTSLSDSSSAGYRFVKGASGYSEFVRTSTSDSSANLYIARGNDGRVLAFYRNESSLTQVGNITVGSSSTAYNTSSDYRLKENVTTSWDATSRLKQLKPSRFNFKADKDTTVDGFLAHEVSSIVPEAVTGTKDEVKVWEKEDELPEGVSVGDNKLDDDGNTIPVMQGIDQSKLVPLLVKTIQELEARITALEAK